MSQLGIVETAMRSIEKVQTYIGHGMDDVLDVALDLAEVEVDAKQLDDLQQVMMDYARMEQDLKIFTQAVDHVKTQVRHADTSSELPDMEQLLDAQLKDLQDANSGEELGRHEKVRHADTSSELPDMEQLLDAQLKDLQEANSGEELGRHEKVKELKEKLWECQNPGEKMQSQTLEQTLGEDEDFVMTQSEVVTKCPITQQDMKDPVRNKICGHNYEKEAISMMIKKRQQKCPVSGCMSGRYVSNKDLEDNRELKKYIERKNRMANKNKRQRKGPSKGPST